MIKNKTVLEIKLNERVYEMSCDPLSPLGELYDALCAMKSYVIKLIQDEEKAQPACCEVKNDE